MLCKKEFLSQKNRSIVVTLEMNYWISEVLSAIGALVALVATVGRMPLMLLTILTQHWIREQINEEWEQTRSNASIKSLPIRRIRIYGKYNRVLAASGRTDSTDRSDRSDREHRMINDVLIEVQLDRKQKNPRPSPLWSYFLIANDTKLRFLYSSLKWAVGLKSIHS